MSLFFALVLTATYLEECAKEFVMKVPERSERNVVLVLACIAWAYYL